MRDDPRNPARKVLIRYARNSLTAGLIFAGAGVIARRSYARHLRRNTEAEAGNTVTVNDGVRLHTEVDDHPDARLTIVFVHGFAASLQEFQEQRMALRDVGRLVLFDHRGHGSSGWGRYRTATIEQIGHDLGQVIDDQPGSTPMVLIAHSMGGMATLALAKQRPELFTERIAAVALLSTAAGRLPSTKMPREMARLMVRTHLATVAAWLLWLTAPLIDWVAPFRRRWGRRWLLHRLFGGDGPPEAAAETMLAMWRATPLSMVTAFYPALVRYNKTDSFDAVRSMPVLVLSGSDDHAIPSERSKVLAEDIGPNAQLVLVEGAGHMVNLTHPEIVNDALRELLVRAAP